MCSLSNFPSPPRKGTRTLCEFEGQLITSSTLEDVENYSYQVQSYPTIHVSGGFFKPSMTRESIKNAFIQHTESVWKKALMAWHEQGIMAAMGEFSRSQENGTLSKIAKLIAHLSVRIVHYIQSLHGSVFPHLLLSHEAMCAEFSTALEWNSGIIKAFCWHPQTIKCSLAFEDDTIRIYMANSSMVPVLKYWFQKGVTDMAWKPFSASLLAVACQNGILLWNVDPSSLVTRPSSSCVRTLKYNGHLPVTSIAWHPDGCLLLVSASAADTSMIVWDVSTETATPLQRVGGGGVSLLKWSPDGARLMAATPSSMFRVWETMTWTCERFTNMMGRCHAACWSADGSILLFATKGEPIIYYLSFSSIEQISPHSVGGSKSAIPLIDVSQITVVAGGIDEIRVGGRIQMLAWDKTSERLAVAFKDNPEIIAVFRTRVKPVLEISPCGFVCGFPGEMVQLITFHDAYDNGALLTVCWSSGRVSNIPFVFIPVDVPAINCNLKLSTTQAISHRQALLHNEPHNLYST